MLHDYLLFDRRAPSDVDEQWRHQVAQIEAPIETVGESGQVVSGALAVLQRVEGAGQRGLEVAKQRVDPHELRQIFRFVVTDDHQLMGVACFGDGREATQTVADDCAARCKGRLGTLGDGIEREATDQVELQESRPVLAVQ